MIGSALRSLRGTLTLISLITVLFTEQIPRPLFDVIVMTYRYEWRAMSYALFMHIRVSDAQSTEAPKMLLLLAGGRAKLQ